MKDKKDNKTADLLKSAGAKRQEKFRESQAKAGKKQRLFWLTDNHYEMVKKYLEDTIEADKRAEEFKHSDVWQRMEKELNKSA